MSAKILNNIVLHFLETLPPAWLFDRSYTTWARDKSLTSQLPMVFKIYAAYTNIYFKIFKRQHYLRGGRHLIKLITLVWKQFQQHTPFKITINNRLVCLDLADPRFLAVIQELKEMADTKILSDHINEGDTFLDIGANQGAFSIIAAGLVGEIGKVIAVEPQHNLANCLRCSLYNYRGDYSVHEFIMCDENGDGTLIVPDSYSGKAGMFEEFSGKREITSCYSVPKKRFDDAFQWSVFPGKIFIKLDIEGAEFLFLKGARNMITERRPTILMELNPSSLRAANITADEMRALLLELGYHKYYEIDHRNQMLSIVDLNFLAHRNIILVP